MQFDWNLLGECLSISENNCTVLKNPDPSGESKGRYAIWGRELEAGKSTWAIRFDHFPSDSMCAVGLLTVPFAPACCDAPDLHTFSISLSDTGTLARTGRGGQELLTGRAALKVAVPWNQSRLTRPRVSTQSAGVSRAEYCCWQLPDQSSLSFTEGDVVTMIHHRSNSTLAISVNGGVPACIPRVPPSARPFVNLKHEGDIATCLAPPRLAKATRLARRRSGHRARPPTAEQRRVERLRERRRAAALHQEVSLPSPVPPACTARPVWRGDSRRDALRCNRILERLGEFETRENGKEGEQNGGGMERRKHERCVAGKMRAPAGFSVIARSGT
jgi:hypothetical protein